MIRNDSLDLIEDRFCKKNMFHVLLLSEYIININDELINQSYKLEIFFLSRQR